ncbi:MAG: PP2C family protein-serine/threonine phosphatase [Candidatus Omnitrophota bacterium]
MDNIVKRNIGCATIWGGIQNADFDIAAHSLSASLYSRSCAGGKGGDIYYFSVCGKDKLTRIAVADVVGHGEDVSEISAWVYESLVKRMSNLEGNGVLSELNDKLQGRGLEAMTTAAVVAFYTGNHHLYFSYAGHPPLFVKRRYESSWSPIELKTTPGMNNLPLGIKRETYYDQNETPLEKGDRVFLYTDGVIEAPDADHNLYGKDRLLALLNSMENAAIHEIKNAVLADLLRHTSGSLEHDDVTMLVLEVNGSEHNS